MRRPEPPLGISGGLGLLIGVLCRGLRDLGVLVPGVGGSVAILGVSAQPSPRSAYG